MSDTETPTVKKTTRARKTVQSPRSAPSEPASFSSVTSTILEEVFNDLVSQINEEKSEFVRLQTHIEEVRQAWVREQKNHGSELIQRDQQEELARKREQEGYDYEALKTRRKAEDDFQQKKLQWERELESRRGELAEEKKELEVLRKQVAGFDSEMAKAIKEEVLQAEKELNESFNMEKRLREQEIKSEKELLALKITNFTQDNTRQIQEIAYLKKALEDATRELKDVAVKVIQSSSMSSKSSSVED